MRKTLTKTVIMLLLSTQLIFASLVPARAEDADVPKWVPTINVLVKGELLQKLINRNVFADEAACKAYLASDAHKVQLADLLARVTDQLGADATIDTPICEKQ